MAVEEFSFDFEKLTSALFDRFVKSDNCEVCKSDLLSDFHSDVLNYSFWSDKFREKWNGVFNFQIMDNHLKHHCVFSKFASYIMSLKNAHNKRVADLNYRFIDKEDIQSVNQAILGDFKNIQTKLLSDALELKEMAMERMKEADNQSKYVGLESKEAASERSKDEKKEDKWYKNAVMSVTSCIHQLIDMEKLLNSKSHQTIQNHLQWLRLSLMQQLINDIAKYNARLLDAIGGEIGEQKAKTLLESHVTDLRANLEHTWMTISQTDMKSIN